MPCVAVGCRTWRIPNASLGIYHYIQIAWSTTRRTERVHKQCASYYEGHLESKKRFAIKKYLLIIGKKKNMQVLITHLHLLLHIVTLDIEALVVP